MKDALLQSVSHDAMDYYWRNRTKPSAATPSVIADFRKEHLAQKSALRMLDDIIAGRFSYDYEMIPPESPTDRDVNISHNCLLTCDSHLPMNSAELIQRATCSLTQAFEQISMAHHEENGAPPYCSSYIGPLPETDSHPTVFSRSVQIRFHDMPDVKELQRFAESHRGELAQALRGLYKNNGGPTQYLQ